MTREKILEYVRDYYDETGNIPSVRAIAQKVEGVNRANFYTFFASTDELAVALGFEPMEAPRKPVEAMEARKVKSDSGYRITLNETQSKRLLALAFMENRDVSVVIDDILDRERQIREVMEQVERGGLDSELIEAILNPELVYKSWNVSEFAGKPWIMLKCKKCGDPLFYGEALDSTQWLFEILPAIKRAFHVTCNDCLPKPRSFIRIPT